MGAEYGCFVSWDSLNLYNTSVMSPPFGKEDTKPRGTLAHAFVFPAHGQALHTVLGVDQGCRAAALGGD